MFLCALLTILFGFQITLAGDYATFGTLVHFTPEPQVAEENVLRKSKDDKQLSRDGFETIFEEYEEQESTPIDSNCGPSEINQRFFFKQS